jgi:hypothetical protein
VRQPFTYRVAVTISAEAVLPDELAGSVAYSDSGFTNPLPVNCGGSLFALSATATRYVFREQLTYGSGCVNRGTVELLLNAARDTLRYHWYVPTEVLSSIGVLTRGGGG